MPAPFKPSRPSDSVELSPSAFCVCVTVAAAMTFALWLMAYLAEGLL